MAYQSELSRRANAEQLSEQYRRDIEQLKQRLHTASPAVASHGADQRSDHRLLVDAERRVHASYARILAEIVAYIDGQALAREPRIS